MRHSQICGITCCVISLLCCTVDYGFGKLPVPTPQRLPVDTFPRQIGDWVAGADLPVDSDVQAKLVSAKIVDRTYTDSVGHSIDLTLVTANDNLDIHDPHTCLPDQGWHVDAYATEQIGDQPVTVLDADQNGQRLRAIYWWTGFYPPKLSQHFWVQDAARLRAHLLKQRLGASLLVRILSDRDENSDELDNSFTNAILSPIKQLTDKGRIPS